MASISHKLFMFNLSKLKFLNWWYTFQRFILAAYFSSKSRIFHLSLEISILLDFIITTSPFWTLLPLSFVVTLPLCFCTVSVHSPHWWTSSRGTRQGLDCHNNRDCSPGWRGFIGWAVLIGILWVYFFH